MALKLEECRRVFLDSTIIADLLNIPTIGKYSKKVQERIRTVKCLIDSLSSNKSQTGERTFIISTVSIAEIYATSDKNKDQVYDAIQMILNTNNLEIISFNRNVANTHNTIFKEIISDKEIQKIKIETGYKGSDYVNVKELIRKDYLIIATAQCQKVDIVFTCDNNFNVIARKIGLYSFLAEKDNFIWNQGDDKIYGLK